MSIEQATYEKGWATCLDCDCRVRTESTVSEGASAFRCRMRERCAELKAHREAEEAKWKAKRPEVKT